MTLSSMFSEAAPPTVHLAPEASAALRRVEFHTEILPQLMMSLLATDLVLMRRWHLSGFCKANTTFPSLLDQCSTNAPILQGVLL